MPHMLVLNIFPCQCPFKLYFLFFFKEPGVYVVFVSAILQDSILSVKIASNMLEREVSECKRAKNKYTICSQTNISFLFILSGITFKCMIFCRTSWYLHYGSVLLFTQYVFIHALFTTVFFRYSILYTVPFFHGKNVYDYKFETFHGTKKKLKCWKCKL
jgi:hypothetical protein